MYRARWLPRTEADYNEIKEAARKRLASREKSGKKKSSQQEGLFKQVHKALTLLLDDPRHPGLNTHRYYSLENPYDKKQKVFEAYVQQNTPAAYRIFWCYGPNKGDITILAITRHP